LVAEIETTDALGRSIVKNAWRRMHDPLADQHRWYVSMLRWSDGIFGPTGSAPIESGAGVATVDAMLDPVPAGVSAVPEPAPAALLIGGVGLLGVILRRYTRQ
jgi:hypothetical protein